MDPTLVIHDVQEKEVGAVKAPSFPAPRSEKTGFPEHKKRVSAFKRNRQAGNNGDVETDASTQSSTTRFSGHGNSSRATKPGFSSERASIDQENKNKLDDMSPKEIAQARQQLFDSLDPDLISMLLKRSNIDAEPSDQPQPADKPDELTLPPSPPADKDDEASTPAAVPEKKRNNKPKKMVTFSEESAIGSVAEPMKTPAITPAIDEDGPPLHTPDLFPINSQHSHSHGDKMHFPQPATPDLDPSDPNFLQNLHDKYFPNLPADPSRLAWMAPVPTEDSAADRDSPYYPGQDSLPSSAIRFDFKGNLLPPRLSRTIPVSQGLHHHGEAPEAAGYTIPELARLARSSVPAQRCIAFQSLGRILYRLGRGEWGSGDDEMGMGLWRCVQQGRVLDTLGEAASVEEGVGHRSARMYAIEALWLFEKGGWRERFRGR